MLKSYISEFSLRSVDQFTLRLKPNSLSYPVSRNCKRTLLLIDRTILLAHDNSRRNVVLQTFTISIAIAKSP